MLAKIVEEINVGRPITGVHDGIELAVSHLQERAQSLNRFDELSLSRWFLSILILTMFMVEEILPSVIQFTWLLTW